MTCPECQSQLQTVDCKGVEIHECSRCHGRWFDRGELRQAKNNEDQVLRWLDFDPFGADAIMLSHQSVGKSCPKCLLEMNELTYQDSKIVIDKCPQCEGVWLHQGEFEKIIAYLEKLIISIPVKDYLKETFKQFLQIFTGKDGIKSEVKDFLAVLYLLELRVMAEHPKLSDTTQSLYNNIPFK